MNVAIHNAFIELQFLQNQHMTQESQCLAFVGQVASEFVVSSSLPLPAIVRKVVPPISTALGELSAPTFLKTKRKRFDRLENS